jgi:hypothetical protein
LKMLSAAQDVHASPAPLGQLQHRLDIKEPAPSPTLGSSAFWQLSHLQPYKGLWVLDPVLYAALIKAAYVDAIVQVAVGGLDQVMFMARRAANGFIV